LDDTFRHRHFKAAMRFYNTVMRHLGGLAFASGRRRVVRAKIRLTSLLLASSMFVAGARQQSSSTSTKNADTLDDRKAVTAGDGYCSEVALHFQLLRQPPIYHLGERIQARICSPVPM